MFQVTSEYPWFALKVRTRSEAIAVAALRNKDYVPFSPTYEERRRYSDRIKIVNTPIFPGYIFCRFDPQKRVPILNSPAVEYIVGFDKKPAPIPDDQIETIGQAVKLGARPVAYVTVGERVRVVSGALAGLEGIITRTNAGHRLVLSVDMIQRSVALHVDADRVESITAVHRCA